MIKIKDIIMFVKCKYYAKMASYHINRGHKAAIKMINDKAVRHAKTAMKYLEIYDGLIEKLKKS